MIIAQYFVEFIFYSFLGWVWESIYCTINEKKWADRGFLFGPICPIYGSCVVAASMVFSIFPVLRSPEFPIWGIFILCVIGSAIAEFGTSWVLEKRFNARWWDYSHIPLNIQGRICLPVSLAFGAAGVLVVKFLIPFMEGIHEAVNPLIYEIIALVFALMFGADFALTEASLSALLKDVKEMHDSLVEKYQAGYEKLAAAPKIINEKIKEGKEAAEARREQMAEAYAKRLSFNQKRILQGINKFMPKKEVSNAESDKHNFMEALRKRAKAS
jgi:uncharacterized membrane protein